MLLVDRRRDEAGTRASRARDHAAVSATRYDPQRRWSSRTADSTVGAAADRLVGGIGDEHAAIPLESVPVLPRGEHRSEGLDEGLGRRIADTTSDGFRSPPSNARPMPASIRPDRAISMGLKLASRA